MPDYYKHLFEPPLPRPCQDYEKHCRPGARPGESIQAKLEALPNVYKVKVTTFHGDGYGHVPGAPEKSAAEAAYRAEAVQKVQHKMVSQVVR